MATKMIKFNLQMKGVKVTSFDELQENFCADILPIFQTGRLVKWLMSRELVAQSEAIAAIDKNSTELQQLAAICRELTLDDDEEVLQFLLDDRQTAQAAQVTAATPAAEASDIDTEDTAAPSLSGVDWSGQDMSGRQFIGEDLRHANLRKTNFSGSDLSQADFTGADLSGANLSSANLYSAKFNDALLIDANLNQANLNLVDFTCSDLTNANLTYVNQELTSTLPQLMLAKKAGLIPESKAVFFIKANLTNANLQHCSLECANFTEANLTKVLMREACLFNVNFSKADLSFANLAGATFGRAHGWCRTPDSSQINLTETKLTGVIGLERPIVSSESKPTSGYGGGRSSY